MGKPILLYDNRFLDGTITATDTAADYDVNNIKDLRAYTFWKAASAGTKYLTVNLNKLTNPGFETGSFSGWAQMGSVIDSVIKRGAYSAKLSGTGAWVSGAYTPSDKFTFDPQKQYRVRGYLHLTGRTSGSYGFRIYWYNSAGANVAENYIALLSANTTDFTMYEATVGPAGSGTTFTYPAEATTFIIQHVSSSLNSGAVGYLDDVSLFEEKPVDALAVIGHNFLTAKATISLESSDDNFATFTERLAGFTVSSDRAFLKLATKYSAPYHRIKLVTTSVAPQLAVAAIGQRLTFERYLQGPFDPAPEKIEGDSQRSKTGNLLGSVVYYHSMKISAGFKNVTPTWIRDTFKPAWDGHLSLLKPFFFAWDPESHSDEVFFVKVPENFELRLPYEGVRRSLSLEFEGVKE